MRKILLFLFLFQFWVDSIASQDEMTQFSWSTVADLADLDSEIAKLGFAGMFAGEHRGAIILAGGANFPNGMPWYGGEKHWWNQIYILESGKEGFSWIKNKEYTLNQNLAYGASVSTPKGLILIGGENESGPQKSVTILSWNPETRQLNQNQLPSLPVALSYTTATYSGGKIYVAGGEEQDLTSDAFFVLDISVENPEWESLKSWPGSPRSNAVLISQLSGDYEKLYLFGGRKKVPNDISELYADVFEYDPKLDEWSILEPIKDGNGAIVPLSAMSAAPYGSGHILLFGGVTGSYFSKLEALALNINNSDNDEEKADLEEERKKLIAEHPGFINQIFSFHAVTKSWTVIDDMPFSSPVNTTAVTSGNYILVPSGEISPGIRTPEIKGLIIKNNQQFGTLNYIVLGGYLGILVIMGFFISKKQHNLADFFKAGGRVPWWAAGISVFGTQLSAITFMAIPAKTFSTDWTLFFLLMTIIMISPVIIALFLPFFRRLNLTTAYEYLELRFNRTVRNLGSIIYVTLQFGRLGIVLLLPSLALSVVTGMSVELCILIMGVLSILYTVLGGIEAVIWTDVIQVLVLLGGALISLVMMVYHMDMEWGTIKELALDSGKMKIFDTSFDFTGTAIWVVLIGGLASNLVQYGSDQTVIQRYLTTKDEKTAARGILTGAWMALPSALIFFAIGTALYLFYLQHPQALSPVIQNTDSIFPWYIVTQLPQGVSGLLIAAVFAAAMSSLDSSMNSVATVITTDFYNRWFPLQKDEGKQLTFARWVTIVIGVGGTLLALVMANMGIPSLWDQFNMLIGLFAGGLGGIFLIGILSRSVNGQGAVFGLSASALVQILVKYQTDLSIHLYAFTGLVSAILFTYLFSLLFQKPSSKSIEGLTIHSLKKEKEEKQYEGVMAYRGK
ncbi:SSS sodium solute transporter [Belliella baltica DSM 15883]|uniref:SSS sodium solute transporter n=1 Tax=Belliella baltica (strain DSM 15883 / CIP 108006 / LMG 21964 / BA134) TaxID=866536 RepID=I3Z938_BELBD|nr:sodium/solute symporter [Belliella baltica]AFL85756.1 SSS sodium solute transporter [Belliella baltica DSM 15883]